MFSLVPLPRTKRNGSTPGPHPSHSVTHRLTGKVSPISFPYTGGDQMLKSNGSWKEFGRKKKKLKKVSETSDFGGARLGL